VSKQMILQINGTRAFSRVRFLKEKLFHENKSAEIVPPEDLFPKYVFLNCYILEGPSQKNSKFVHRISPKFSRYPDQYKYVEQFPIPTLLIFRYHFFFLIQYSIVTTKKILYVIEMLK